ncbi:hypothetical protein BDM02DRAFT_3193609 [Thelephora ganbajun]|uniref:Uncharacterized protein n=1 Tax=Thelephora ganbajun TaxID=370292 RepID=A0ACB6YXS6_THEGA|nr:hypothetical protein BDM02DRAFT_3193609 [Thelephora ganbajun]
MSTVDGRWLERDLDVQHCWDNIRQPMLFGTALNKIVQEPGAENVSFLEITPHPVLKSCIEEVGGNPISLICRPNPKVPAQNTGEHFQFLEGISNLLMTGYAHVNANKLAGRSDGIVDFVNVPLPPYPYSKSSCWVEDDIMRSLRLRAPPRPLAQDDFCISVNTHPDLTGHVVMGAVLYPGAGYTEAILENGAFVVENVKVLKPFVLNGHDTAPGHAGVIINGDYWEFRGSTESKYVNGKPVLETVYASGYFKHENPDYDPENLPTLDIQSLIASLLVSTTGDEFYENLPSSYDHQDHFRNYTKELHAGTPDVYGKGYCIHPGILDSITQIGLCMFMNMTNKTFDFNGTFLPISMKKLTRWDPSDSISMEEHFENGTYVLYKPKVWGAKGPFVSDCVIADSTGRVFFTIGEFEIPLAPEPEPIPITDYSMQQCIVTTWQPKALVTPNYSLPPVGTHGGHSYLAEGFETLFIDARNRANRFVSRVLDLDPTNSIARAVDVKLSSLLTTHRFAVDYFAAGTDGEAADAKVNALNYPHGRSTIIDTITFADRGVSICSATVNVILVDLDIAKTPVNFDLFPRLLAPSGVAIFLVHFHSVLFEDTSLSVGEREGWIHTIRQNPKILDNHLKVTPAGEVLVRHTVQGSPSTRDFEICHFGYSKNSHGHRSLAAAYPPLPGPNEVKVAVEAFGLTDLKDDIPLAAFLLLSETCQYVVVDKKPIISLSESFSITDVVSLPTTILSTWVGLVEVGRIEKDSIVLVHDALSCVGRTAIQIVQGLGVSVFFTVALKPEVQTLSTEFGIDVRSIAVNASTSTALASAKDWLEASGAEGFNLIFNSTGRVLAAVDDVISSLGLYVHNKKTSEPVKLPADAPATRIVDIVSLIKKHPAKLAASLDAVLNVHVAKPFKLSPVSISFSDFARPVEDITHAQVLIIKTTRPKNIWVDPVAQLFDPRKTYLLVGGCSEFGIGITVWMFNHGACHIYLTSRRGRKALSPVDELYLRDINNKGGDARAISCDVLSKADMAKLIKTAESVGPLGGIMLMTVAALNVILELIDLNKIDFNLLFSTIGTVFGNAGQAPYLAAQLYLDKIAETLPNTISMSFPPITDSARLG